MYPVQTIVISILICIGYFVIRNLPEAGRTNLSNSNNRRAALSMARMYLAPYRDIWRNLRLSNKFCTLHLGIDGETITATETIGKRRSFRIINSKIYSYNNLWDMFCMSFDHLTSFDRLLELCNTFQAEIKINEEHSTFSTNQYNNSSKQNTELTYNEKIDTNNNIKEKLDVNNASEVELTALPGISIVMAKKLIKKREEIGGFKSVNEVCLFLKLKPHMQTQLENLICVKKMKGSLKIKRYNERNVDI